MKDNMLYHASGKSLFSDGRSIFINYVEEPYEPHLHAHDFIEISYVAAGKGVHILGDQVFEVSKGDLFLINVDVPHQFLSTNPELNDPLHIYNCVFRPEFIDMNLLNYHHFSDVIHYLSFQSMFSLEEQEIDDIRISTGENAELELIYRKLYEEFTHKKEGYMDLLRIYLIELLIKIFRIVKQRNEHSSEMLFKHDKQMENVLSFVNENYKGSLKLKDIARLSFLSPTYFCKIFKDYTGVTFTEYVQKLRLDEACELLIESDRKIIEIAQHVGYSDLKHFNELFKKHYGVTPSEYRKQKRKISLA